MQNLYEIALRSITKPRGNETVLYSKGLTEDIISSIQDVFNRSFQQTKEFAKYFNAKNLAEIHQFVRQNITYQIDKKGQQLIKTPGATIHQKFGDCKAYSILIASILENLNVPFLFRFVQLGKKPNYSHVYVVAYPNTKKEFILDACIPYANFESNYIKKYDMKPTTKIVEISGLGMSEGYSNNYYSCGMNGMDYSNNYIPEMYFYNPANTQYYNEIVVSGFFDWVGDRLKDVGDGVKNAFDFVKDNVVKPYVKFLEPLTPAILQAVGIPPNVTKSLVSIRNKLMFNEGEINLDFATFKDGAQLIGVDTNKGIFQMFKKINGKMTEVIDPKTGLPKAIQVRNAQEFMKLPLNEQVQVISQMSEQQIASIYKDLPEKEKKILDEAMSAASISKFAFTDYVQNQNEKNTNPNPNPTPQAKKRGSSGLLVLALVGSGLAFLGKGKK